MSKVRWRFVLEIALISLAPIVFLTSHNLAGSLGVLAFSAYEWISRSVREESPTWWKAYFPAVAAVTVAALTLIQPVERVEIPQFLKLSPSDRQDSISPTSSHYVRHDSRNKTVIVFVAGPVSNARLAWSAPDSKTSWPQLLTEDSTFASSDIFEYYSAPATMTRFDFDEFIDQFRITLDANDVFKTHKTVIFISHSLGGTIVQGFLTRYRQQAAFVPFVAFYSVPTSGSALTRLSVIDSQGASSSFIPRNLIDAFSSVGQDWVVSRPRVNTYCVYETKPTMGLVTLDPTNAERYCDRILQVDEDFASIAQPRNVESASYRSFVNAFQDFERVGYHLSASRSSRTETVKQYVSVDCGRVAAGTIPIQLSKQVSEGEEVVATNAQLRGEDNLKASSLELLSHNGPQATVRYQLVGLDKQWTGNCPGGGHATIEVNFIITGPN
jgi:hypothetical protein